VGRQLRFAVQNTALAALLATITLTPLAIGIGVHFIWPLSEEEKEENNSRMLAAQHYLHTIEYISTIINSSSKLLPVDICVRFTETAHKRTLLASKPRARQLQIVKFFEDLLVLTFNNSFEHLGAMSNFRLLLGAPTGAIEEMAAHPAAAAKAIIDFVCADQQLLLEHRMAGCDATLYITDLLYPNKLTLSCAGGVSVQFHKGSAPFAVQTTAVWLLDVLMWVCMRLDTCLGLAMICKQREGGTCTG
jgi:hypothetical protein